MNKEQAVTYLKFSGFSDEQIKAIEGAFTCDKCVYSISEGCQYDDITETIPPFETSDDAISRQAVIDAIDMWVKAEHILETLPTNKVTPLFKSAHKLPPVNPQLRTGHWIKTISENGVTSAIRCSECGFEDNRYMLFKYCPHCGAKMIEPQERSDKE